VIKFSEDVICSFHVKLLADTEHGRKTEPISTKMGDGIRVQFPVPDIYHGM